VLYKARMGFAVCARRSLHACTLLFARDDGGDQATIRIGPIDIDPIPSCDGIVPFAMGECSDAGVGPFDTNPDGGSHPSLSWLRCAALHGLVYRGGTNTSTVDPRDVDPNAHPGQARLQCDEGFTVGTFDDTL